MLIPIVWFATCVSSFTGMMREADEAEEERAGQTMRACSTADEQACAEVTGTTDDSDARGRLISGLSGLVEVHGAYLSLSERCWCKYTNGDFGVQELRARAEFERVTTPMTFRWRYRGERWVLTAAMTGQLDTKCDGQIVWSDPAPVVCGSGPWG